MRGLLHLFIALGLGLFAGSAFAQKMPTPTLHPTLSRALSQEKEVYLVLRTSDWNALKSTAQYQVREMYSAGEFTTIALPTANYAQFKEEVLEKISHEVPMGFGQPLMDTALIHNRVDSVHQGLGGLDTAYTGKGVIIGILDDGIYFRHPDFQRPDGSTRIRYIWDQTVSSGVQAPLPFDYGEEWNWIDIDNGTCTHVEPVSASSHGTTVAGAAVGNGLGNGRNKGVAPESEIIAVRLDFSSPQFLFKVADAVQYVFEKADALGRPCVINISAGTYRGSHDGRDLASQLIDAQIEEQEGRVVVAAAGNSNGTRPYHLGYDVDGDTAFTWFTTIPSVNQVYFDNWSDSIDFANLQFQVGADDNTTFTYLGGTEFLTVDSFTGDLASGAYLERFMADSAGLIIGRAEFQLTYAYGRYHLECLITPTQTDWYWRFTTTGQGRVDVWAWRNLVGTSDMIHSGLPADSIFPDIVNYRLPDRKQTIVSGFQCSDRVITVGNFNNKHGYFDVDSVYRRSGLTPGEINPSSSEGPTRDNRLKPDISATGSDIFASANPNFINPALSIAPEKVAPGALHGRNGGTSMASPIVAGVAALYLEKNPNAPWYETKEVLLRTARRDSFTTPMANTLYGEGKVNPMQALRFEAILGCTDSTAFNYNPLANIEDGSCIPVVLGCTDTAAFNYNSLANTDDGSCIPVVMGCMDTAAVNYDSLANVDDGSCLYEDTTGLRRFNNLQSLSVYPNPADERITLFYAPLGNAEEIKGGLYGFDGRLVRSFVLPKNSTTFTLTQLSLSPGLYILHVPGFSKQKIVFE